MDRECKWASYVVQSDILILRVVFREKRKGKFF